MKQTRYGDRYAPEGWTFNRASPDVAGQWSGFGLTRIRIGDGLTSLPQHQVLFGLISEGDAFKQVSILDCGWPLRSLRRVEADSLPNAVARMRNDYQLDRNTDGSWRDFHPLLLGTLINTVLYALVLRGTIRIAVVLFPATLSWFTTRLVRLVVVLPIAAVINIATAWACAAYSGTRDVSQPAPPLVLTTEDLIMDGIFSHPDLVKRQRDFGVERSTTVTSLFMGVGPGAFHGSYSDRVASVETRAGWPCYSLRGLLDGAGNGIGPASQTNNGILLRWRVTLDQYESPALLPTAVLAAGFAINTIFYAAILWLLFAFPFVLRRRRRTRRGLCVACGYDLRGFQGRGGQQNLCPECGSVRP